MQASIEVQQPQLAMTVEGPTEMRFGETAAFRIRVSNPGNGPAEERLSVGRRHRRRGSAEFDRHAGCGREPHAGSSN